MPTETRTYIGETGTQAFDGWAGFRVGQTYQLRVEHRDGGRVAIALDHGSPGAVKEMSSEEFEKWFRE